MHTSSIEMLRAWPWAPVFFQVDSQEVLFGVAVVTLNQDRLERQPIAP